MIFNWVDVLLIILFFKGLLSKKKYELIPESIDLIGVIFATVITLHYFVKLGKLFQNNVIFFDKIGFLISYCFISVIVLIIFQLIREGWVTILKIDVNTSLEKAIAFIIMFLKSYFVCSLIFFALVISNSEFAMKSAAESISSVIFKNVSVSIYKVSYLGFISKFFPEEEVNKAIVALETKNENQYQ